VSGAPVLSLRGVSKRFGPVQALDSVDLDVGEGEFVVVLGATGAGKTTLLRVVAGLEPIDAGSLAIGGADAAALDPAERDVALVFQNFSLYPNKSVRENLAFPLRAPTRRATGRRLPETEIAERVEWAAKLLHVERLLDRPSRRLSGGEMQRVAIGRAIVRRPRLFLMDEPLSNLDAKLREELRVELRELARRLGTPVLWVTHDQSEALEMADRVVALSRGRVLQSASPEELYLRPVSPQVARLLGSPPINLIEVTLRDGSWTAGDGTRLLAADTRQGTSAQLGIRPEHVLPDGGESEARVEVVEDVGPSRVLLLSWAGADVHALVDRTVAAKPGDVLRPRIAPGRALVFPRGTGAPAR
jgi:multiple sugar transport system ATP-binding protein